MGRCNHRINGERHCKQDQYKNLDVCLLHTSRDRLQVSSIDFAKKLQELIDDGIGDFRGLDFPENFNVSNSMLKFENIENIEKVDFTGSVFGEVSFENIIFDCEVNFNSITVNNNFKLLSCTFNQPCSFNGATFKESVRFISEFKDITNFRSCDFMKSVTFKGNFYGDVYFNSSVFHENALFEGQRIFSIKPQSVELDASQRLQRNVTRIFSWVASEVFGRAHTSKSLFHSVVELALVDFRRPDRVRFNQVDLSKAILILTDFSNVQLYDVKWYQPKLKRNGLYEESQLETNNDFKYRRFRRPQLEMTYRNIRKTLESQKDYDLASDFLVGEMEQKRKQLHPLKKWFSIINAYDLLSQYGTRPLRVGLWLSLAITSHFAFTYHVTSHNLAESGLRTLQIITFQRLEVSLLLSQSYVDATLRLLAPFLLAILAMTIRARIKRF